MGGAPSFAAARDLADGLPALHDLRGLSIQPGNVTTGSQVNINVNVGGGTGPYTLNWVNLPNNCSLPTSMTSSSSSFTCYPSQTGNFAVQLSITDHNGLTNSSSGSLMVSSNGNGNNNNTNNNGGSGKNKARLRRDLSPFYAGLPLAN